MQRLRDLLDSIVDQTAFDVGRTEMVGGCVQTSFASRPDEVISPEKLREILERNRWDDQELNRVRSAQLILPDESISQLESHLRLLLKDYIDTETDRIGYALPCIGQDGHERGTIQAKGLFTIDCASSLDGFTKGLIKGGAILGVERVTCLLSGWLEGQPIEYRTSAILNGVTVSEAITPIDGVHIEPLPLSSDKLPAHLPKRSEMSVADYLGRTIISIDCTASPALFRPQTDESGKNVQAAAIPNVDIDTVCQALSLECDSQVEAGFYWHDYQELAAFFLTDNNSSWSLGTEHFRHRSSGWSLNTDFTTGVTTLSLENQSIPDLAETQLRSTLRALGKLDSKTRMAVSRWMKSKDSSENLADRFIDLRIALESLYLKNYPNKYRQEMGFRLALFGAWYLGTDFGDRKRILERLRKAYGAASGAVHGGDLDFTAENQKLLSDGQDLCRRGILKLLKEGPPPDWGDLILGAEDGADSA